LDSAVSDDCDYDDSSLSSDFGKKPAAKPTNEALLALSSSDFRIDRCHLSKDHLDVAETDEKTCHAADDLLPKSAKCKDRRNLEDHRGMYPQLGKNLSKTSSQDAVNNAICDIKAEWPNSALQSHSDKTVDPQKHEEFLDAKKRYVTLLCLPLLTQVVTLLLIISTRCTSLMRSAELLPEISIAM
jgi:hypothetical protein